MKTIFKTLLYFHFFVLIKILLLIKKPYIVAIVGWENKSIIREKLKNIMIDKWLDIKKNQRKYNTWFGISLTILDLPSAYGSFYKWILIYFYSFIKFIYWVVSLNDYLILEFGIDDKWETKKFLRLVKPDMVIFTSIRSDLVDDFKKLDIVEQELSELVCYLNLKSKFLNKINNSWDLNTIATYIQSKEKYIWVVKSDNLKISHIWEKLIRKILF